MLLKMSQRHASAKLCICMHATLIVAIRMLATYISSLAPWPYFNIYSSTLRPPSLAFFNFNFARESSAPNWIPASLNDQRVKLRLNVEPSTNSSISNRGKERFYVFIVYLYLFLR